ncbi:Hvo_1808 family surface protein [Halobacteria archaeon AArc-dxtr1]|nr:Hvo_1808 family surface protein [Halobacteria archaeon AArc-dxtr1]
MPSNRSVLLSVLAVASILVVGLALGGVPLFDSVAGDDDRTGNHETAETLGYVEGYWYDDTLPVDDRDDAVVVDDELDAVVYRSMARVEQIRELPFEETPPVEVLSREEFQDEEQLVADRSSEEAFVENVRLEALFVADRDRDAGDARETLYGDSVLGFYDPGDERIVLVSEQADEPELDEVTLAHELLHALQDQHFGLADFDRETQDQDHAVNGLVEGDAVWVEREYADRCDTAWDCTLPETNPSPPPSSFNWGLYFSTIYPYVDGPAYVDHLLDTGGWDAVNAAYDDPPASSAEVIRPGEDREPRSIEVADRSDEGWQQYEVDGEVARDTIGEAGMVAMFADGTRDSSPSVLDPSGFLSPGGAGGAQYEYDQTYTDGWAGDELVVYASTDVDPATDLDAALSESGYVWQTEWTEESEAEAFLEGYRSLLEIHDAEAVSETGDVYEIDADYPGAYAIEHDGDTVTIVRAPSVDDLSAIEPGVTTGQNGGAGSVDEPADDDSSSAIDAIPGLGAPVAVVALLVAVLAIRHRS